MTCRKRRRVMSGRAPVGGDTVQGWSMERVVGSGSFATVWLARRGAETAAIKVIATERLSSKLKQSLESEVTILRKIDHPNIVRLLETVKVRPASNSGRGGCLGSAWTTFLHLSI
jgi:serine/threonine protein kinase